MSYSKNFYNFLNKINSSMTHDEVMSKYYELNKYTSYPVTTSYPDMNDELIIYRITNNYEGFNPDDFNCFSYPRPRSNVSRGRANIEGVPVFYGSIDIITAFAEKKNKIKPNEKFYISRWRLKLDKLLMCILALNNKTLKSSNPLNKLANKINQEINFKEGKYVGINKLTLDLGNLFSEKGDKNHYISSAFAYNFLQNKGSLKNNNSVLFFPSVERKLESMNIAIPDYVADNSKIFDLENVHEAILIKNEIDLKDKFALKFTRKAIFKNRKLENWFLPNTTISSIDYESIELKLYDGTILKGKETANIHLYKSYIPVKEVIQNLYSGSTDRFELPENLYFRITDSLFENEEVNKYITVLKLDHGYKIPSNKTYSCIEWAQVTISLKFNFSDIDLQSYS